MPKAECEMLVVMVMATTDMATTGMATTDMATTDMVITVVVVMDMDIMVASVFIHFKLTLMTTHIFQIQFIKIN